MTTTTTKPCIALTLCVLVHDEDAFRAAAEARAIEDGLSPEEAAKYRDPEEMHLGHCAQMLLDPGMGPNGSEITDSSWEDSL